jgi:hypothetical protein
MKKWKENEKRGSKRVKQMQNREEFKAKRPPWESKNDGSREGEKYNFHKGGGGDKYRFRTQK